MPRQTAVNVQRDFKMGLITEATGLNYPENACVDTDNCEFDLLGRASRRQGFDLESAYTTQTIDKTLSSITTYYWRNVTGDGTVSFGVVQIGSTLYFYDASNTTSFSAGYKTSTVDLTAFSPVGAPTPRINACQFSDGFGKLFVVHSNLGAFYVTYNQTGDTFTATAITLQIRDFEGLVDSYAISERPAGVNLAGLSKEHNYNLRNQGWDTTRLTAWDTAFTDMPSNADVWWSFKDSSDVFQTSLAATSAAGNTAAPKGHFLLNPYSQDRSTVSGVASITTVTTDTQRATATAFYAGRVWYSGINYPNYNSNIYFSQTIESPSQFGYCYQKNDPTAEDFFDLLPTDGGVIKIPEAGTVYKLFPMQTAILVFAARGVWAIYGNSGLGFTANDYSITKVSSIRTLSASSFVDVNGSPIYWNSDGIFTVQAQQGNGGQIQFNVVPMTYTSIQEFYDNIPNNNKAYARGFFNPQTQIVQWLYSSESPSTIDDNYTFDRILVYNARSNAFYPWSVSDSSVKIHGIFVIDAAGAQTIEYTVIDAATDTVIDAAGDTVVAYAQSASTVTASFKYLVSYPFSTSFKFTMADNFDTSYLDWTTYETTGIDYDSYFTTGYKIRGNAAMKFQSNYVFFYNEDNGVYDVQGIWDYALSGNTGKYTSKQRLTYDDAAFSNLHKKVKIRGSGRSLQYKVSSVTGEPFTIIGWSAVESANSIP